MKNNITRRRNPRRVINAININNEIELLEIRVHELKDVVDVFLICESSYTTFGEKKPLRLLERLHGGFLKEFQHKFLYVFLDHFPPGGYKNGWIADDYLRTYLSKEGLKRLNGLKQDDLFILNDADEIPRADDVIFLKFYDGFGEPISLWYRWNLYGFFWQNKIPAIKLSTICTVGFLQQAYDNDAILLRRRPKIISPKMLKSTSFIQRYRPWSIGSSSETSGWHCSWCFPLKEFPIKLRSAQSDDGPRWGDYPEKYNLKYIKHLIKTGLWFDNRKVTVLVNVTTTNHAPSYVLKNFKKLKFLIFNPYRN
ncbi:beta-1,4-mannosyl-glycoprotein 4-beta-N-acetylglucosaminyltransferase-like [Limulus polyphemus]|uniref:Beta-1,4-mannosyl-glycoprotein 4-beta-N-acetylglucosaminyltransferase-like n=1 Tax=Limulus polyphemus TaxID=6850 RepID=A0ABM1SSC9_LIMPO|nr:beta-1,4-mannosyl-glycoprotein 4-beta-N-acetylglucosaminyltransferase-like [Limulus polyphemus]